MDPKVTLATLHRTAKLALDSGEVGTLDEAMRLFAEYRLSIEVGSDISHTATGQVALLTAVNAARRCFLGGVEVSGPMGAELLVPWGQCGTLGEAVLDLEGMIVEHPASMIPRIALGNARGSNRGAFAVQATWDGWSGGVTPLDTPRRLPEQEEFTPAGVLAGAIAVSEAFQHVRGDNSLAGRRDVGLSLWRPERTVQWLAAEAGPPVVDLPAKLWLIGLGHLGQAYLWTLGFLPYAASAEVELVLQDVDELSEANDSTSPLTRRAILGRKKTRAMASWAEKRGFRTTIVERLFAKNFRLSDQEPRVALSGVDNSVARSMLEDVGFDRIVEAGLGKGIDEYLAFQLHSFPGSRRAHQIWDGRGQAESSTPTLLERPAYRALATSGVDDCGLTLLAGRTVGASFVGLTTSALVIAELARMAMGAHRYEVMDGSLKALNHRTAVLASLNDELFNPGTSPAITASSRSMSARLP